MAKSEKSTIKKDKTRTTLALGHTHNAAHTSKTRSSVQHGYTRAFQHKIYNNNRSGSENSPITCDGSKRHGEEGWMRIEGW